MSFLLSILLFAGSFHSAMSDTIGRITVPTPAASALTFPLAPDFGYGITRPWPIIVHRIGELATKAEQRFQVGVGPRKFPFKKSVISYQNRQALFAFYESVQGSFQSFIYNAPQADKTTVPYSVIFEQQPLTVEELTTACRSGFNFVECPSTAPSYSVASTCLRFPSTALKTALLSQVQQIIPLIHIRVREVAVPDIYLSDRRCTVGGQLYLARLLGLGEPGSEVLMSQDIKGTADNVQFSFGNADRVMTELANDTDLVNATVDLSLYHINSGILLQLWKGFIIPGSGWQSDGSSVFPIRCSDGLYQVTQQYPSRTVNRTCWKTFNDGVNCPYSSSGTGGSPTLCSYYFTTPYAFGDPTQPGGCTEHGMTKFFGGQQADPQGVNILDNSTGVLGFGRNNVTATSIVSDTIYGQALPDVWCNDRGSPINAFYVNALMMDVRDEGDFFDGLGIIGAGPIGAYEGMSVATNADGFKFIVAPLMDGFPPQGFKVNSQLQITGFQPTLGLREVLGNDPVNTTTDSFSLGQGTPQVWGPEMAAGTAFVELRYAKPSGIAPSTPDQHSMTVPISKGLSGWTWDAGNNRTLVTGMTNPFWIAANTVIRALGLNTASATAQLALFVRSSLYVGDGSGTAEIADLVVPQILGTGTETQFQFQGTIAQQKPLRDWLTEILNCALGYYTFEFGQLKLGIRENASAVEAFTIGNILYQSLKLTPIEAAFEHLIIDFADVAYQYQANTADYQDKDHAAYYGRAGAPLTARFHSAGCSTLSQSLRVAATRVREEVGGVNAAEWKNARNAAWGTTILALNTEVGQVVSMTHPDVPGGVGNFRIQKWTLMKDWSIQIQAKTVTVSMYDLDMGPKPADVTPNPLPVLFYPEPLGEWAPFQVQADEADALFPGEYTFDAAQSYEDGADGTAIATLTATGSLPVNKFLPNCGAPVITGGGISQATTGGFIPGGVTLRVSVCANNADGLTSPPSFIVLVQVPAGTNTNAFTISNITWPAVTGLINATVFLSTQDDLICAQQTVTLTPGTGGTTYTPTSITVIGPFTRSTWGLPNPAISKVRVKAKLLLHGGVLGAVVDSVTGSTIVSAETVDIASIDNWSGRVFSVIGRNDDSTPFASYNITSFNPTTGTFVVDRDASDVRPGDVFVVCVKGNDNSANPYQISDLGLSNAANFANTDIAASILGTFGGNPSNGNTTIIAGKTYTFQSTLTNVDGHVLLGSSLPTTINNLVAAINLGAGAGSLYAAAMTINPDCSVTLSTTTAITCTALVPGVGGNSLTASGTATWSNGGDFTGGAAKGDPTPHSGLLPDSEIGSVIRGIKGTSRGLTAKVVSNGTTGYTLDSPFPTDSTSVWIVEQSSWPYSMDSSTVNNATTLTPTDIALPTSNFLKQSMLIGGFTVDNTGAEAPDGDAPVRMIYLFGGAGTTGGGVTFNGSPVPY